MRPVRFVALSEDGQALVLADEVGRLLTLPIDDRVSSLMRTDRTAARDAFSQDEPPSLAPRDIQARIRSGESAEDVARIAGVPVDRVLRYAGPVLQERAMLAQHARRTKLKTSDQGASLADVVDSKLSQHGVDMEKISWDAYRRDDGTWRVVATWPSGKANATAVWELDKARQLVAPSDDMAHYLCGDPDNQDSHRGHEVAPPRPDRGGHEPILGGQPAPARPRPHPGRARSAARLARASTRDTAVTQPGADGASRRGGPGRFGRGHGRDSAPARSAGVLRGRLRRRRRDPRRTVAGRAAPPA